MILFLGLVPFIAFSSFVPLFAEDLGQESVGGVFGLYAGLVLVVRIVGARLPDRLGWRRGSTFALCGVGLGVGLVAVWASVPAIWLAAVPLGIGMSLLYPSLFTAVMAAAPESERSHAVGTFSVFFDLSSGFGATLIGVAVSLTSYRGGFAVAAAHRGRRALRPVAAARPDRRRRHLVLRSGTSRPERRPRDLLADPSAGPDPAEPSWPARR